MADGTDRDEADRADEGRGAADDAETEEGS